MFVQLHRVAGLVAALSCTIALAQNAPATNTRVITVSGQGQVSVVPDEVVVALGVESFNLTLGVAKEDNDQRVERLVALAPRFSIKSEDVHMEPVRIQPSYRDPQTGKELDGYFVRRSVEMKLADLTKFEELVSAAIEAGANYIQGVNFRSKEAAKFEEKARLLAVKDAKNRASTLAGELNLRIGKPQNISEAFVGSYCAYNAGWGYVSWGGGQISQQFIVDGKNGESGGYALGNVQITATVSVTFELEG